MKKIFPWMNLLTLILLVACSLSTNKPKTNLPSAATTPTLSSIQMQTQVSQLLTMMPTTTGQPAGAALWTPSPTTGLPTIAVVTETPAKASTVTPLPAASTSTATSPAPTSAAQAATATGPVPTQTQPAGPTATSSPGDPRARLGTPSSTDHLDNPNTWIWPTGSDDFTLASFSNGRMAVQALTTKDGWRMANPKGRAFANIYLEATFKVASCPSDVAGMADHYGVIVRVPVVQSPNQGYLFGFNCNGQYSLRSWNWDGLDVRRQDMRMLIDWTAAKDKNNNSLILAGANQTNIMGIMAVGSRLRLYANGNFLAEYDYSKNKDIPQLSSGYFGVFVGSRNNNKFTVWVDDMSYWENPQP